MSTRQMAYPPPSLICHYFGLGLRPDLQAPLLRAWSLFLAPISACSRCMAALSNRHLSDSARRRIVPQQRVVVWRPAFGHSLRRMIRRPRPSPRAGSFHFHCPLRLLRGHELDLRRPLRRESGEERRRLAAQACLVGAPQRRKARQLNSRSLAEREPPAPRHHAIESEGRPQAVGP